ncbi:MAG: tRNA (5-methylaminomethyl-2-thiouridylate)-methyltransferase, partial [Candidatus Bipolaricaulota bacterium]|nr:tRNA (5-methylaminomethyl-2-thiouridylate)-methyltransferase [Candidatus Bipolaricaulota bacterium]
ARSLQIPLRTLDLSEEHLQVIKHPRHGYGSAVNPCVDCRIFMLQAAKRVMEEEGAKFVVTGEVLGQRPMSQHRRAMGIVSVESGLDDRLLRPLSANLLPDTLPVKEGWISRGDLFSISGRSRQEQMRLADEFGITDYPQSAGGCILTDKVYGARLRDAFSHVGKDAMGIDEFVILRYGRQFRISEKAKVFVGRNERENEVLARFARGRYAIEPLNVMGPLTLVEGDPSEEELSLAAGVAARYCDHNDGTAVALRVSHGETTQTVMATPLLADDPRLDAWRIEPRR